MLLSFIYLQRETVLRIVIPECNSAPWVVVHDVFHEENLAFDDHLNIC